MSIQIDWQTMPPQKGDTTSTPRLFPRMKDNGTITVEELCKIASQGSVFSRGELFAALSELTTAISRNLAEGKTIDIPDLGTFKLSIGTDSDITAQTHRRMDKIKIRGINFQPSPDLLQAIGTPPFHWSPDATNQHATTLDSIRTTLSDYFLTHPTITRAEFEQLFRMKRSTAQLRLKALMEEGFIEKEGHNREARYVKA